MSDLSIPVGTINPQPLTVTFITPDNTLVDDTVRLVDDPVALIGSTVTPRADYTVQARQHLSHGWIHQRR